MRSRVSPNTILLATLALSLTGCAAQLASPQLDPLAAVSPQTSPGQWTFDLDGDRKLDCREIDADLDGVVDRFEFDTDGDGAFDLVTDRNRPGPEPIRTLALFVDGVPFQDLAEMWSAGYFREFHRPGAMVSPFPSMTYVSFAQMLGVSPPPGYEELYYDIERDELAGGVMKHLGADPDSASTMSETFLAAVGYKQPALYSGLVYVFPDRTMRKDLRNVMRYVDAPDSAAIVAYVGTSDGIAHKLGKPGTRTLLIELDRILRELILQSHGRLRILMASDHGNNYIRCRRIDLAHELEPFGFKMAETLLDSSSVVIPAFGLVGFAAAYLDPERASEFAAAAVQIPGVDLAIYDRGGTAHVIGSRGRGEADITLAEEPRRYRYEPEGEGDPLELRHLQAALVAAGKADSAGFIADRAWYEATLDHTYPDAIRRVYEAAAGNVQNPAAVLLSFDDSSYYGSKIFDALVDLAGTHGNLRRPSTLGCVLSNDEPPLEAVRSWDMRDTFPRVPFGPSRRAQSLP